MEHIQSDCIVAWIVWNRNGPVRYFRRVAHGDSADAEVVEIAPRLLILC